MEYFASQIQIPTYAAPKGTEYADFKRDCNWGLNNWRLAQTIRASVRELFGFNKICNITRLQLLKVWHYKLEK